MPLVISGVVGLGDSLEINATAAMMLAVTLLAIVVAYAVLRRPGQERDGATLPGV